MITLPPEPLLYRIREVATMLGVCTETVRTMEAQLGLRVERVTRSASRKHSRRRWWRRARTLPVS